MVMTSLDGFQGLSPMAYVEALMRSMLRCCITRGMGIVIMLLELAMMGSKFLFIVVIQMGLGSRD